MLSDTEQSLLAQGVHAHVLEMAHIVRACLREANASKARTCRGMGIDIDTS